jgi:3',5'-cyclic AMP phosphodiesterase CpdA
MELLKMKKFTTTLILIAAMTLLVITGCSQKPFTADKISPTNPWTNLEFNDSKDDFHFVISADRTGGKRDGIFTGAIDKINHLQPEFVICVGDLIDGYGREVELAAQWDEFDAMVGKLEMPFFYITGNHDNTGEAAKKVVNQRRDRTYYHFLYKDVLFLCLNSEDVPTNTGGITDEQHDYFADVLKKYPNPRWTCVFIHKPLWEKEETTGWEKFSSLLKGDRGTIFAGHHHRYSKQVRNGLNYYKLATTGAGSDLSGPQKGKFDHVMSVTMTADGPRIANLMLDGIFGDDPPAEAKPKVVSSK